MPESTTTPPAWSWETWALIRIQDAEEDYRKILDAADPYDTPQGGEETQEQLEVASEAIDRAKRSYEIYKTSAEARSGAFIRALVDRDREAFPGLVDRIDHANYAEAVHGRLDKTQAERDVEVFADILAAAEERMRAKGYPRRPVADPFEVQR